MPAFWSFERERVFFWNVLYIGQLYVRSFCLGLLEPILLCSMQGAKREQEISSMYKSMPDSLLSVCYKTIGCSELLLLMLVLDP